MSRNWKSQKIKKDKEMIKDIELLRYLAIQKQGNKSWSHRVEGGELISSTPIPKSSDVEKFLYGDLEEESSLVKIDAGPISDVWGISEPSIQVIETIPGFEPVVLSFPKERHLTNSSEFVI